MKVRKYLKVFYTCLYVVNSERSMAGWGLYVKLEAFHASLIDTTQLWSSFSTICCPDCSKCESFYKIYLFQQIGGLLKTCSDMCILLNLYNIYCRKLLSNLMHAKNMGHMVTSTGTPCWVFAPYHKASIYPFGNIFSSESWMFQQCLSRIQNRQPNVYIRKLSLYLNLFKAGLWIWTQFRAFPADNQYFSLNLRS